MIRIPALIFASALWIVPAVGSGFPVSLSVSQDGREVAAASTTGAGGATPPRARLVHVVQPGETLFGIARAHGITAHALAAANQIDAETLVHTGQQLVIPNPPRDAGGGGAAALRPDLPPDVDLRGADPESAAVESEEIPIPLPADRIETLRLQVLLDHSGFTPGKIDALDGTFTQMALRLCRHWSPGALEREIASVIRTTHPEGLDAYIDRTLPMSGGQPDFPALTANQRILLYQSMAELLAERWHTTPALLQALNPGVNLETIRPGTPLVVPNAGPFEIESFMRPDGSPLPRPRRAEPPGTLVEVDRNTRILLVWRQRTLIAAFPVTINPGGTPTGDFVAGAAVTAPPYMRRATNLDLLPGPNSPVGLFWIPLGGGLGIHGTNDPISIGRSSSAGCIRLSNWDAARLAKLIATDTPVHVFDGP